MKGHKASHHRMGRSTGGMNDAEEDLKYKPEARTNAKKIDDEAEERKAGGRVHGKGCRCHKCWGGSARKAGEKVEGEKAKHHAGRKPRKSGGRATSDANPFTSARAGTPPKGHNVEMENE